MCGIVGIAGDCEHKDQRTMQRLLAYDYFRGPDATGFAAVRNSNEVVIDKVASHPFDLFERTKFKAALSSGGTTKVMLGHNRLATKGANTNHNAHPFHYGDITGVHNGTLSPSSISDLEKELGEKFEVDSQALLASIDRFGLKDTIEAIQGAWSIVYYDAKDNTINFIRNKERPMHYGYTEDFKKLLWASDWWMIDMAARQSEGYKMYLDSKKNAFFETEVDTHYRWELGELRKGGSLPKPKVKQIKGKEVAPSSSGYCPFQRTDTRSGTRTSTTGGGSQLGSRGTTTSTGSSRNNNRTFHQIVGRPERPFGDFFTEEMYLRISKGGCAWCGSPLEFRQRGQTIIESCDAVLCPECTTNSRENRVYTKVDMYFD